MATTSTRMSHQDWIGAPKLTDDEFTALWESPSLFPAAQGALRMIELGVPVAPIVKPGEKYPPLKGFDKSATTDEAQVREWIRQFPEHNWLALARPDGVCFIDEDQSERLHKLYFEKYGEPYPRTRTTQSQKDHRQSCWLQTDRTRALGNQAQRAFRDGILSFRQNNQYCLIEGSHLNPSEDNGPNHRDYICLDEPRIIPMPDNLVDLIESLLDRKDYSEYRTEKTSRDSGFAKLFDRVGWEPLIRRMNRDEDPRFHNVRLGAKEHNTYCPIPSHGPRDLDVHYARIFGVVPAYPDILHCFGCDWSGDLVKACYEIDGGNEKYATMYDCARAICKEEGLKFENFFPKREITHAQVAKASPELVWVMADQVVPKPIDFLWYPYLQQGALNAFYGRPSAGKGFCGIDIVARLTTGRAFPGQTEGRPPLTVAVLAAEEAVADTLVPRLMAAQAERSRVRFLRTVKYHHKDDSIGERMITFQQDMELLQNHFTTYPEDKFLFIDPITNYCGDVNFNQDGEVRPVLTMLANLAEEFQITVLMIGHFNKNTNVGAAMDKAQGARAWVAVPRAVWGFVRNPDNKQERIIGSLKVNNVREEDAGMTFTVEDRVIGTQKDGKPWIVGGVCWGRKAECSLDEIIDSERPENRRDSVGERFIQNALKDGVRKARDIYSEADKQSISESTVKRACNSLGILKYELPEGGWIWQLKDDPTPIPPGAGNLNSAARRHRHQQVGSPIEKPLDVGEASHGMQAETGAEAYL